MARQTAGQTNHRWWPALRHPDLALTVAGTQNSHDLNFSPRRNFPNKRAKKPAAMHRRLHILLVQHGARPAACDPCAISKRWPGEQNNTPRANSGHAPFAVWWPWLATTAKTTPNIDRNCDLALKDVAIGCENAPRPGNCETCTELVRNLSQKQAKLRKP